MTHWALQVQPLWLFLDYDGTLADFAPTPDDVRPDPGIVDLFERLARKPGLRITVLSGRRLEHARRLLPIPGIFLAGTYGIELLTPGAEVIQRGELADIRPVLENLKPQWLQIISERSGFYLEDKGWSLALHARFADAKEAEHVLELARQMIDESAIAGRFRVLGGHQFLEIAPWLASKKEAVTYLLGRYTLPAARLLYIGDDDKDEEAFPVIHARQGVAIQVLHPAQAARQTEADFFFESPADTLRWLRTLL